MIKEGSSVTGLVKEYVSTNPPVYPGAVDLTASAIFSVDDIKKDDTIMTPTEAAVIMNKEKISLVIGHEYRD